MPFKKYSQEQLIRAVQTSTSIREVLRKLQVAPYGGNYAVCKGYMEKLGLDTSHFRGQGHRRGRQFGPKRPLSAYLDNSFPITSHRLRTRLLREGVFVHQCSRCQLREWNGEPIPLELEHRDGNHQNNSLANLTLLCPNCHAQTPHYRGRKPSVPTALDAGDEVQLDENGAGDL